MQECPQLSALRLYKLGDSPPLHTAYAFASPVFARQAEVNRN
ncbi:hypothetical protein BN874_1270012 [Candidatus Contendobacter odensis Run_B_J11]|uniref:Uncharacterized protein n=1 Tax=Candidatus Contendobacter odensis Run_B_J11 TaxID=1400861 RepID=A0A7U7J2T7_9GAMM|nr:hypothetical protein BN874_1270012 [Candidatus Contendobacter odensis Run_B_J11]